MLPVPTKNVHGKFDHNRGLTVNWTCRAWRAIHLDTAGARLRLPAPPPFETPAAASVQRKPSTPWQHAPVNRKQVTRPAHCSTLCKTSVNARSSSYNLPQFAVPAKATLDQQQGNRSSIMRSTLACSSSVNSSSSFVVVPPESGAVEGCQHGMPGVPPHSTRISPRCS